MPQELLPINESPDENPEPTGDLAALTASVSQSNNKRPVSTTVTAGTSGNSEQQPRSKKTKKNKQSRNYRQRRGSRSQKQIPTDGEDEDDEEDDDDGDYRQDGEASTTHVTVRGQRGTYCYYPASLFDIPPKKLRLDHLRKKYLISEIARANAERRYYRYNITFLANCKTFIQKIGDKYGIDFKSDEVNENSTQAGDHGYAMHVDVVDRDSTDEESDNSDVERAIL